MCFRIRVVFKADFSMWRGGRYLALYQRYLLWCSICSRCKGHYSQIYAAWFRAFVKDEMLRYCVSVRSIIFFLIFTFTGPCILIYFCSKTNQIHQCLKFILLEEHSTCFGRSFRPSSGFKDCNTSTGICQTDTADCGKLALSQTRTQILVRLRSIFLSLKKSDTSVNEDNSFRNHIR